MSSYSASKINQLLKSWPQGTVATSTWLAERGVYQQLAHVYQSSAWIESMGKGAFKKSGDSVSWLGALFALQSQLDLSVLPAAKTALALHGVTQFVPLGGSSIVYLFGPPKSRLPSWFKQHDWDVRLEYVQTRLFGEEQRKIGLSQLDQGTFSIYSSSRERAILEVCYLVPKRQQYEEARFLMEGLQTLRPKMIQSLLEACQSVKAKRLFLHLAEKLQMPWFEKLKIDQIDLGKGKRTIVKGGVLDSKYDLVVPRMADERKDVLERP
jgi:hypothetical protein